MLFTTSLLYDLLAIVVSLIAITIAYFKWQYQYWKNKNVPYLEPTIPFGNIESPLKQRKHTIGVNIRNMYETMREKGWKHGGAFTFASPSYMTLDLDVVKQILAKDFHNFVDRGIFYNEKDDPISAHLFAIGGTKWKNLRSKLTPTFTSGKMKMMFQTLVDCEPNMRQAIQDSSNKNEAIDIKNVLGCFTTDIIGNCAFGLECNSFKDENSPFRTYGKKVFTNASKRDRLRTSFANSFPKLAVLLKLRQMPKDVSDFYTKIVTDTVNYREKNNVTRKDFLQLLIDLKNNKAAEENGYKHDGQSLTLDEVVAQAFIFFFAGFETSSTTMTFVLYELARNPDIQDKVRQEIEQVLKKYDGKITYEAIQDMKYMNQVIDETLRKYPPVPFITRRCVKDYKMPDADFTIDKGTRVIVPIYGIHHDKEYYPDPEKFDPERFNEDNKKSRHQYAWLPFGEGPRICIGLRFGVMQSKVGLTSLLKNFKFTVNKKTQEPLIMSKTSFVLAAEGEVWLDAQKV